MPAGRGVRRKRGQGAGVRELTARSWRISETAWPAWCATASAYPLTARATPLLPARLTALRSHDDISVRSGPLSDSSKLGRGPWASDGTGAGHEVGRRRRLQLEWRVRREKGGRRAPWIWVLESSLPPRGLLSRHSFSVTSAAQHMWASKQGLFA
jgi:hypothetical protein